MKWTKFALVFTFFFSMGCGVKGPPQPPQSKIEDNSALVEDKDVENSKKKSKKQSK